MLIAAAEVMSHTSMTAAILTAQRVAISCTWLPRAEGLVHTDVRGLLLLLLDGHDLAFPLFRMHRPAGTRGCFSWTAEHACHEARWPPKTIFD